MRRASPYPLPLTLLLAACAANGDGAAGGAAGGGPVAFVSEVAFEAGEKLGGCAVGDLLPEREGDELVAVSVSGAIYLVREEPSGWRGERIGTASGEAIQVAVGDLDPAYAGDEALAVGMLAGDEDSGGLGAVHLLVRRADGAFDTNLVLRDAALVHAVGIADLDPARPGLEGLVGGFSRKLTLVWRDAGEWGFRVVGETPAPAKGMVPHQGGMAIACNDGRLVWAGVEGGEWVVRELARATSGLARLASHGATVLAASDEGALFLHGPGAALEALHREPQKLRGAVLADLDPGTPGDEAATAGYEGRVTLLRHGDAGWAAETVHAGTSAFHHLTLGELSARSAGPELAAVGFAGQVVVVRRAP